MTFAAIVFAIAPLFTKLQNKYQALPDVLAYLNAVQQDIIENVDDVLDSMANHQN